MAGPSSPSFSLPAERRIRYRGDFQRAREKGGRAVRGCLIVNWLPQPNGSFSRVGVITTRKMGNAVARARARRLLRETFRLHQHQLREPVDLVLVARPSIAGKKRTEVETDFLQVLTSANLLKIES